MTAAQKLAALATLVIASAAVVLGIRTPTNPQPTRACIPFSGTKPAGLKVTSGVVALSPQAQTTLGLSPVSGWAYAGVEVQSVDGTAMPDYANRILGHIEVVPEAVWDRTAQGAVAPNCEVLVVREDDSAITSANVFQCGCFTGSGTCTWSGGACRKNLTFDAGTFSGTGVIRKPCVELAGTTSMPAACR